MADNPMLAATKAAQAARAKGETVEPSVPSKVKPTKAKRASRKAKAPVTNEKMTTVKIPQSLAKALAEKAQQVRNNNTEPVAPADRVYPAHLIQAALEHLLELDMDWNKMKDIEGFKTALKKWT